ncbi:MAG: dihydroneopterin aldolase [Gammaproteobacteria bacterium]|jgi:dihydroneopterin aldolase|nr:dihydroneopterin aldolase [Gammaproteobacteria bacterium]
MMDKLTISGIKLTTLIGIHDWEKQCPQNLHLDVVLQTDAKKAALEDNIQDALDYDSLVEHIVNFVENYHFQLIETLAERLAQEVLNHFPTNWVQITLHKPGALLKAKDVAITIERSQ